MRVWLKELREKLNLTQVEVSKLAEISESYYNMIENGERGEKLPVPTAQAIATALSFDWTRFYESTTSQSITYYKNLRM